MKKRKQVQINNNKKRVEKAEVNQIYEEVFASMTNETCFFECSNEDCSCCDCSDLNCELKLESKFLDQLEYDCDKLNDDREQNEQFPNRQEKLEEMFEPQYQSPFASPRKTRVGTMSAKRWLDLGNFFL